MLPVLWPVRVLRKPAADGIFPVDVDAVEDAGPACEKERDTRCDEVAPSLLGGGDIGETPGSCPTTDRDQSPQVRMPRFQQPELTEIAFEAVEVGARGNIDVPNVLFGILKTGSPIGVNQRKGIVDVGEFVSGDIERRIVLAGACPPRVVADYPSLPGRPAVTSVAPDRLTLPGGKILQRGDLGRVLLLLLRWPPPPSLPLGG